MVSVAIIALFLENVNYIYLKMNKKFKTIVTLTKKHLSFLYKTSN